MVRPFGVLDPRARSRRVHRMELLGYPHPPRRNRGLGPGEPGSFERRKALRIGQHGAIGSGAEATRSSTVRIVQRSGRRSGSSSSSQVIGTETGAPGAARGLYGATSVLLIAFCV